MANGVALSPAYGGKRMRLECGAICLIALFVALSDQESGQERCASKQLAPGAPYTLMQTDLEAGARRSLVQAGTGRQIAHSRKKNG